MRNFRNYEIWKNGIDIADNVYSLTDGFTKFEIYAIAKRRNYITEEQFNGLLALL